MQVYTCDQNNGNKEHRTSSTAQRFPWSFFESSSHLAAYLYWLKSELAPVMKLVVSFLQMVLHLQTRQVSREREESTVCTHGSFQLLPIFWELVQDHIGL